MTYEKLVECRNNKKSEEKEYEKNKVALENKEKEIHRSGFDVILGLSQITGNYYASQIKMMRIRTTPRKQKKGKSKDK